MNKFNGRVKMTKQDNYNTPKIALEHLLNYIEPLMPIWMPFYNDGSVKKQMEDVGFLDVFHEDKDFFTYNLEERLVIDNPPYSIKEKVIEHLYKQNRPFSLLLPMDTLERKYMLKYQKNLQVLIPPIRYDYNEKEGKKSQPPFKSVWICWNMKEILNTNKELIFME